MALDNSIGKFNVAAAYEGKAIKTPESATVFIVQNGRKFGFNSQLGYDTFAKLNPGLGLGPTFGPGSTVIIVTAQEAASIADGGFVNDNGILIPSSPAIAASSQLIEESIDLRARSLANEFVKQIEHYY